VWWQIVLSIVGGVLVLWLVVVGLLWRLGKRESEPELAGVRADPAWIVHRRAGSHIVLLHAGIIGGDDVGDVGWKRIDAGR